MTFIDFVIKHDQDPTVMSKRVIKSIVLNRLRYKKPSIMFISGDSGEGKSYTALRLQEILLEWDGMELKDYLDVINVFYPVEYPKKLDKILFDKQFKKIKVICMHEAREIIRAKMWYNFLNQAISDVNAMSRAIKRLCIIVISQFIRDISTDIRYTINYYCKTSRPQGKAARLYIYVMWKDDRDLEKPKLRKRRLTGFVIYPNGRYRLWRPKYLELSLPKKENIALFDKLDVQSKKEIIRKKMDKLIQELEQNHHDENKKVNAIANFYIDNDKIREIGKAGAKKFKLKKEIEEIHDLTPSESKQLSELIFEKLKELQKKRKAKEKEEFEKAFED